MNIAMDDKEPGNMNDDEIQLLNEMSGLVDQLSGVLMEEYDAVKSGALETLHALLVRKEQLLVLVQDREAGLGQVLSRESSEPAVHSLKVRVRKCHELNERNKTVTQVQIGHTRKSLELLRSMLMLNDVPVYGATGEVTISREKRDFGSA